MKRLSRLLLSCYNSWLAVVGSEGSEPVECWLNSWQTSHPITALATPHTTGETRLRCASQQVDTSFITDENRKKKYFKANFI